MILLERVEDIEVVGQTGIPSEVVGLIEKLKPDVVTMDIGLPGSNGIQLTRSIKGKFPEIKIIGLSTHCEPIYVRDIVAAGAVAYVPKAESGLELIKAIRAVRNNQTYISGAPIDTETGMEIKESSNLRASALGKREIEVLKLVAGGLTSRQIAETMNISLATVEVHRRNIMRKLGLRTSIDLTRYAMNTGLVAN